MNLANVIGEGRERSRTFGGRSANVRRFLTANVGERKNTRGRSVGSATFADVRKDVRGFSMNVREVRRERVRCANLSMFGGRSWRSLFANDVRRLA